MIKLTEKELATLIGVLLYAAVVIARYVDVSEIAQALVGIVDELLKEE